MSVPILNPEQHWQCPSCGHQHVTQTRQVITPLHACPKWNGLAVALVQAAQAGAVRHRVIVREDYIGTEQGIVYGPNGQPVSAVHTERPDGSHDTHVFAPVATVTATN